MGLFDDVLGPSQQPAAAPAPARAGLFDDVLSGSDVTPGGGGQPARVTVRPPAVEPAPNAGMSQFPKPPATGTEAFGRGLTNAATFNFYDELTGLARAGGLDPNDPNVANALAALVKGGYRKFTGDKEADQAYTEQVADTRAQTEQMRAEHPAAMVGGEVVGALALPGLGAARLGTAAAGALAPIVGRAAPVIGRSIGAGTAGTVFGGASGLGGAEGSIVERAPEAATGAAIGGTIGAVGAPALEGVGRAAGRGLSEAGRYLFPNVETRAAKAVQGTIREAERTDPSAAGRLSEAELAANPAATVAELGGEGGRALARWAANASPEARGVLSQMTGNRYTGQQDRIIGWLNKTFNYPDAAAESEAIKQAGKTINDPAYALAKKQGASGIWDAELAGLVQAPALQDAVKAAIKQAQNRSAPDVAKGVAIADRWYTPDGKPTLEFWDLIKRQLDQDINVASRAGRNVDVSELKVIKDTMLAKLDAAVPSYQKARAGAAGFFGNDNALDLGKSWLARSTDPRAVAREWQQLSPENQKLAQDGFVSAFVKALGDPARRSNMLDRINATPNATGVLNIVLGKQRYAEMEAMLRVENIMQRTHIQTTGNSTTARQLIELGVLGSSAGLQSYYSGITDPTNLATAIIGGALAARGRGTDRKVAERIANMLTSSDPKILQQGLQTVARNQSVMDGLRHLDQSIARIAGIQAGD